VDRQIEELRKNVTELEFNSTQYAQDEEICTGRYYDFFEDGSYH
jgi:peptide methionine sulfoxide reductase MsrB